MLDQGWQWQCSLLKPGLKRTMKLSLISKSAALCLNLLCQTAGSPLRGTVTLAWSAPLVSVLYLFSFFGRGDVGLVSVLAS